MFESCNGFVVSDELWDAILVCQFLHMEILHGPCVIFAISSTIAVSNHILCFCQI